MMLASEVDVLRTLQAGTYTLEQLYQLCEQRAPIARAGGHDPVPDHPGDRRWKRRVRGALQGLRRTGRAARVGRRSWVIDGTAERPQWLLLVLAGGEPREFELRLKSAVQLFAELDQPVDLVLCDPPWALRRGGGHFADGSGYRRDHTRVVPGYVDIDADRYLGSPTAGCSKQPPRSGPPGSWRRSPGPNGPRSSSALPNRLG